MKLKNKKTNEIGRMVCTDMPLTTVHTPDGGIYSYRTLAELNEEWEDYEEPKEYWYIDYDGGILCGKSDNSAVEKVMISMGNCFYTLEEAEKAVERLRTWKRLKDNGFKIKGWKFTPDMKQIQGNYVKIEAEIPQILINEKDLDLLFGGEE